MNACILFDESVELENNRMVKVCVWKVFSGHDTC